MVNLIGGKKMKRIFGILMILALLGNFSVNADTVSGLDKYSNGDAAYVADASSGTIAEVSDTGALHVTVVDGISIGDITTTSEITDLIPGTGATKLGKAEDAAASSGDTGVALYGVRKDTASASGADGDYVNIIQDSDGKVYTNETNSAAIKTAVEILDNVVSGSEMQVDLVGSIPAGTAGIGKLTANSGVDIGDVDITSVVPGTGAISLGKAADSVAGATDTGVALMLERDDALSTVTPAAGDYVAALGTSKGAMWVRDAAIDEALSGTEIQVDVVAALPAGSNAIGKLAANSGIDIGDVDVTSLIVGVGATNLGKEVNAAAGSADTGVAGLAVRDDALGGVSQAAGDYGQILQDANGALWTHDDALDAALSGSEIQVDIVASLPAGTAAIGKLAANTGVDIGDVDITSIIPGGGATELGKAEDAAHTTGDTGILMLGIRNDTPSALAGTDVDYIAPSFDATGHMWVEDDNSAAALTALELIDNMISGTEAQVDIVAALPAGSNAIGKLAANTGVDIGDVDILSVITGTGAINLGKAIDTASGGTDTGVGMLAIRDDILAGITPAAGDWAGLLMDANGALWTHDDALDAALAGSELQVDIVAALPAGSNAIGKLAANTGVDIGDVDVTSVIAGTSATSLGKAEDAAIADGDTGVAILTVRKAAAVSTAGAADDYANLITDGSGQLYTVDANGAAIKTALELMDNMISGTEAQVDIVAALPAGTNDIGEVTADPKAVTSVIKTGDAQVKGSAGTIFGFIISADGVTAGDNFEIRNSTDNSGTALINVDFDSTDQTIIFTPSVGITFDTGIWFEVTLTGGTVNCSVLYN
jgi:hypothetical protein